jgi:hypothetical protein
MTKSTEFNKRVEAVLADAPGVLVDLKHQRGLLDIEIQRVERFQRSFAPQTPKASKERKRAGKGKARQPTAVAIANTKTVALAILTTSLEEFTVLDIFHAVESTGIKKMAVVQAFARMRKTQFIGMVGVDAHGKQLWKILDATMAEQYTATEA